MTPERERIIRAHWVNYMKAALNAFTAHDVFVAPQIVPFPAAVAGDSAQTLVPMRSLEFRLERGTVDGVGMTRVVCEGVELDRWEGR